MKSWHWKISTGPHHNTAQIQHCPISTTYHMWVDYDVTNLFRHWKISSSRHFQNGRHNIAEIQHCPISATFHMLVDYDISKWFLISKEFCRSPFSKWRHNTAKMQHCSISKVAFNLLFKPVVCGRFGRLHNR